jgi:hypothetical protein
VRIGSIHSTHSLFIALFSLSTDDDAAPHTPEQAEVVGGAVLMDEGKDVGKTPRKSRAKKRTIITSPSEKEARPTQRIRMSEDDVSVHM